MGARRPGRVHARGTDEQFGYLASDDAARAEDLMRAWCDPSVQAVFCARGGYGVQRMVDLLDWESLAAAGPKALVGFSDVTALHQAFAARLGLSTIHGPVVTSLGDGDDASREHLRTLLFEPVPGTALTSGGTLTLVPGRAEGVLGRGQRRAAGLRGGYPQLAARRAESIVVLEEIGEEISAATGCSPSCCAPAGSTRCGGSCWARSPTARPRTHCRT